METKHKDFVKRVLDENPELRGDIKDGRWDDFWNDITILVDSGEGKQLESICFNEFAFTLRGIMYIALLESGIGPHKKILSDYMFLGNRYIKNIKLPDDTISIDLETFRDCANLKSIELNDGLKRIGSSAFAYCRSLEEIKIPKTVTFIGRDAFWACNKLKKIVLPKMFEKELYDIGLEERLSYCQVEFC